MSTEQYAGVLYYLLQGSASSYGPVLMMNSQLYRLHSFVCISFLDFSQPAANTKVGFVILITLKCVWLVLLLALLLLLPLLLLSFY